MFTEQMATQKLMKTVNGKHDFRYHGKDDVIIFKTVLKINVGRDSVVRIANRYGLDGPGIESWRDFPHPSRPALRPTQPPIQWVPGLFPGM